MKLYAKLFKVKIFLMNRKNEMQCSHRIPVKIMLYFNAAYLNMHMNTALIKNTENFSIRNRALKIYVR